MKELLSLCRSCSKAALDFFHTLWEKLKPIAELIKSPFGFIVLASLCIVFAYVLATCGFGCGTVLFEDNGTGEAAVSIKELPNYTVPVKESKFSLLSYDMNNKDVGTLFKLANHVTLVAVSKGYATEEKVYNSIFAIQDLTIKLKKEVPEQKRTDSPGGLDVPKINSQGSNPGPINDRHMNERFGETDNLLQKTYGSNDVWEIGEDVLYEPGGTLLPGRKLKSTGDDLLKNIVVRNLPELLDSDQIRRGILDRYFRNRGNEGNMLALHTLFDQLDEAAKQRVSLFLFNRLACLEAIHRCQGASTNRLEEHSEAREFRHRAVAFFISELESGRWLNRREVIPAIALGADFCDVMISPRAAPSNDYLIQRTEAARERDAKREVISIFRNYLQFLKSAIAARLIQRNSEVFYYAEERLRKCVETENGKRWKLSAELATEWSTLKKRSANHPAYRKLNISQYGYNYPRICQN